MAKRIRVFIAASGTGGHLLPAQQLAKKLQKKGYEILFVANKLSNNNYFDQEDFSYKEIKSSIVFKNWKIVKTLFALFVGTLQSLFYLLLYRPKAIIGFGSYHTFPILLAARIFRKKIILFEANTFMGKVNRFFAKKSKKVALQFPLMSEKPLQNSCFVKRFPGDIDKSLDKKSEVRKSLGLKENLLTLLVMGGSQGALFLNDLLINITKKEKTSSFQIIHLCGNMDEKKRLENHYKKKNIPAYVAPFEKKMPKIWQAADIAISRAGAGTISEAITYETPAIFIPYPFASENHQLLNAKFMQKMVKAGVYFEEKKINLEGFEKALYHLMDPIVYSEKKRNIQEYKKSEAKNGSFLLWDLIEKEIG